MTDPRILSLDQEHLHPLVSHAVEFLVNQPIKDLVEPQFVVNQMLLAFNAAVEGDTTESWVRDRIKEVRQATPEGTPGDWVPDEIKVPLKDILHREIHIDRQLVRQLIDHDAIEQLFRDILTDTLTNFVDTLKGVTSATPDPVSRGFGRLKNLKDKALTGTPLGSLTQILEQSAQRKVREHVDSTIHKCLDRAADHLTEDTHQRLQAQWRGHMLDVVLSTDNQVFANQVDALDPDSLVAAISAILRKLIQTSEFQDLVQTGVELGFETIGEKSLNHLLNETGLDYDWRSQTESQLTVIAKQFIQSPQFSSWLSQWLDNPK